MPRNSRSNDHKPVILLVLILLSCHLSTESLPSLPTFEEFAIDEDFNIDSVDINAAEGPDLDPEVQNPEVPQLSEPMIKAVVLIRGPQCYGVVRFTQVGAGPTQISGFVAGLYPFGRHGFHVHQYKISGGNCESAGPHFNPTKQNHGSPDAPESHLGDLGNLQADAKGVSRFEVNSVKISLRGKFSVIERALVVHQQTDDLGMGYNRESLESGNSGGRIGCGTIKFVSIHKH